MTTMTPTERLAAAETRHDEMCNCLEVARIGRDELRERVAKERESYFAAGADAEREGGERPSRAKLTVLEQELVDAEDRLVFLTRAADDETRHVRHARADEPGCGAERRKETTMNVVRDFLGNEITQGASVVYAAKHAGTPTLRNATVISVSPRPSRSKQLSTRRLTVTDDSRARLLRAAFGFALVPPTEPELRLLYRWLNCCVTSATSSSACGILQCCPVVHGDPAV